MWLLHIQVRPFNKHRREQDHHLEQAELRSVRAQTTVPISFLEFYERHQRGKFPLKTITNVYQM